MAFDSAVSEGTFSLVFQTLCMGLPLTNCQRKSLKEIQSGEFHKEWKQEAEDGFPTLTKLRNEEKQLPIEKIGIKILKELFDDQ